MSLPTYQNPYLGQFPTPRAASSMGCCPGLGAMFLDVSNAQRKNREFSAKYGWGVVPGGIYSGVGDRDLAEDVYRFQHKNERCSGTLPANLSTSIGQCYNRDGMIGQTTLQQIYNMAQKGDPDAVQISENLTYPPGYKVDVVPPIACEDLSSYGLSQRPDCPGGGGGGSIEVVDDPSKFQEGKKSSAGVWIALGVVVLAGAGAAYYYSQK